MPHSRVNLSPKAAVADATGAALGKTRLVVPIRRLDSPDPRSSAAKLASRPDDVSQKALSPKELRALAKSNYMVRDWRGEDMERMFNAMFAREPLLEGQVRAEIPLTPGEVRAGVMLLKRVADVSINAMKFAQRVFSGRSMEIMQRRAPSLQYSSGTLQYLDTDIPALTEMIKGLPNPPRGLAEISDFTLPAQGGQSRNVMTVADQQNIIDTHVERAIRPGASFRPIYAGGRNVTTQSPVGGEPWARPGHQQEAMRVTGEAAPSLAKARGRFRSQEEGYRPESVGGTTSQSTEYIEYLEKNKPETLKRLIQEQGGLHEGLIRDQMYENARLGVEPYKNIALNRPGSPWLRHAGETPEYLRNIEEGAALEDLDYLKSQRGDDLKMIRAQLAAGATEFREGRALEVRKIRTTDPLPGPMTSEQWAAKVSSLEEEPNISRMLKVLDKAIKFVKKNPQPHHQGLKLKSTQWLLNAERARTAAAGPGQEMNRYGAGEGTAEEVIISYVRGYNAGLFTRAETLDRIADLQIRPRTEFSETATTTHTGGMNDPSFQHTDENLLNAERALEMVQEQTAAAARATLPADFTGLTRLQRILYADVEEAFGRSNDPGSRNAVTRARASQRMMRERENYSREDLEAVRSRMREAGHEGGIEYFNGMMEPPRGDIQRGSIRDLGASEQLTLHRPEGSTGSDIAAQYPSQYGGYTFDLDDLVSSGTQERLNEILRATEALVQNHGHIGHSNDPTDLILLTRIGNVLRGTLAHDYNFPPAREALDPIADLIQRVAAGELNRDQFTQALYRSDPRLTDAEVADITRDAFRGVGRTAPGTGLQRQDVISEAAAARSTPPSATRAGLTSEARGAMEALEVVASGGAATTSEIMTRVRERFGRLTFEEMEDVRDQLQRRASDAQTRARAEGRPLRPEESFRQHLSSRINEYVDNERRRTRAAAGLSAPGSAADIAEQDARRAIQERMRHEAQDVRGRVTDSAQMRSWSDEILDSELRTREGRIEPGMSQAAITRRQRDTNPDIARLIRQEISRRARGARPADEPMSMSVVARTFIEFFRGEPTIGARHEEMLEAVRQMSSAERTAVRDQFQDQSNREHLEFEWDTLVAEIRAERGRGNIPVSDREAIRQGYIDDYESPRDADAALRAGGGERGLEQLATDAGSSSVSSWISGLPDDQLEELIRIHRANLENDTHIRVRGRGPIEADLRRLTSEQSRRSTYGRHQE